MILHPVTNEDLNAVISWITDKEACKLLAGPLVRFPLSVLCHLSSGFCYIPAKRLLKKSTKGQMNWPKMDTSVTRPMMINPIRIKGP